MIVIHPQPRTPDYFAYAFVWSCAPPRLSLSSFASSWNRMQAPTVPQQLHTMNGHLNGYLNGATPSTKKTIAIVGAGVSGLQAARTLLTNPTSAYYDVI